jgi:hypothetical protein
MFAIRANQQKVSFKMETLTRCDFAGIIGFGLFVRIPIREPAGPIGERKVVKTKYLVSLYLFIVATKMINGKKVAN